MIEFDCQKPTMTLVMWNINAIRRALSVVISLIQIVVSSIVSVENFICTQIEQWNNVPFNFVVTNSMRRKKNGKLHSIITQHNWEPIGNHNFHLLPTSSVYCKALEHQTPIQFSKQIEPSEKKAKNEITQCRKATIMHFNSHLAVFLSL